MKKVLLIAFMLVSSLINEAWAQERTITGKITSTVEAGGLPGVSILIKGTTKGAITDIEGNYSLEVPDGAVLAITYVGHIAQEIEVGSRSVIDIIMEEDAKRLEEVVVTAFGIAQDRKALSYSAQSVSKKTINQASQSNLTNALQGKVAGLEVRQSSGMPGSSSYMTIRGATAFSSNNNPLIVVDGMPIESEPVFVEAADENRVSGSDASSRMLDINPEDIESIDVLKGASAAALYGLRAGNGVIIITTKKGKGIDGDMQVTISSAYTADVVSATPELQTTYAQGNGGVQALGTSMSWGPKISELGSYTNNVGETVNGQVYDNVTPFFKTGGTSTTNVSIAGNLDKGNYRLSLGTTGQSGFVPTTGMDRHNGKLSGDFQATDKLTVGGSMMYSYLHIDKIASGSNLSNPLFTTYYAPSSYDLWGTPYNVEGEPYNQIHYRAAMDNPRWSLANNQFTEDNDRFIGNIHLQYDILDWLKVKYQLGMDQFTNSQKEIYELGSGETGGRTATPSAGRITDLLYAKRQLNSTINFIMDKQVTEDLNVNLVLGSEMYDIKSQEENIVGSGLSIGGFHNISNTQSQIIVEETLKRRVVGFYGNLNLSWKNIAYLNASGRNDYTSNLAAGNRSFFYPSIGTSVIFTEFFDIPQNIISSGKIRASYAEVGQAPDDNYPTQNIFIPGGSSIGGFLTDGIQFPFAGQNGFTQSDILRSAALSPQNTKTIEIGLEMNFLNERLGFDYTYFTSTVDQQIFEVPISPSTGYESELRNAGELKSVGHEVTMTAVPVQTREFRWDVRMNFTKYNNEVVSLAEGVENIYLGGFTTPSIRALQGGTYPSIFGVGFQRDDRGRIVMLDQPGSPNHGMPMQDPVAKKIGDVQSDFFMGFSNTFTYKGLSLTALVDWRQGGQMYSGNNRLGALYGALKVTEDRETPSVLEGARGYFDSETGELVVTGDNDIAILRGEHYWNNVLGGIDEAHIYDTSFVRFRELSIGYSLPPSILENIFIKSATVSVVGRNLFLWTRYPNFDPESSTTGATNGQGLEYVAHPQISSFGGRVSLTF